MEHTYNLEWIEVCLPLLDRFDLLVLDQRKNVVFNH